MSLGSWIFALRLFVDFLPAAGVVRGRFWPAGSPQRHAVGLLRGYDVDARVVMVSVVPVAAVGTVPVEVPVAAGHGLAVIKKPPRIF